MQQQTDISLHIPDAISQFARGYNATADTAEQMRFVIAASQLNISHQYGGPFAAAVFEQGSGQLVALGTNLVTSANLSILHAEIVAITLAQLRLGNFDLSATGTGEYDLVTSCEPCTMCLGAIHWSGCNRVIAAARDADAAAIGFDEGPKPEDWRLALQQRGIDVVTDIERTAARKVLRQFQSSGNPAYNAMRNRQPD